MTNPQINLLAKLAKDKHIENKKYFDKLKKKAPKNLDYVMQELHDAEFKKTDCLTCANCCKSTGPLFTSADIERIAKHLRQKPQQFIEQYLRIYCNYHQSDWAFPHLPLAEFTYNNSLNTSTGMTPFFANNGHHPLFDPTVIRESIVPAAEERVRQLTTILEDLQANLHTAQLWRSSSPRGLRCSYSQLI